jgi:hypothetical protein
MTTFTFTSPEGKTYDVEGPPGATAEQAFKILQGQLGQPTMPPETTPETTFGEDVLGTATTTAGGLAKGLNSALNPVKMVQTGAALSPFSGLMDIAAARSPEVKKAREEADARLNRYADHTQPADLAEGILRRSPMGPLLPDKIPRSAEEAAKQQGLEMTPTRRILGRAAEVVGESVPFLAAGPIGSGLKWAGLSGLGAGIGREVGGETGDIIGGLSPLLKPAGAMALRGLLRGGDPTTMRTAIVDSNLAGMPTSAGQAGEKRFANMVESGTGKFGGTTAAAKFAERQVAGAKETVRTTAESFAPVRGDYAAGTDLVSGARDATRRLDDLGTKLFQRRAAAIPDTTLADASNTMAFLKNKVTPPPGAEATVNPVLRRQYEALSKAAPRNDPMGLFPGQTMAPVGALRQIKTKVGELTSPTNVIGTIAKGDAKQLGQKLKADIMAAAPSPRAADIARRVDRWYAGSPKQGVLGARERANQLYNKPILDFAGDPAKALDNARRMAMGAPEQFRNMLRGLPVPAQNSVRSQIIAELGVLPSGEFTIGKFVRDWNSIPDRTKHALLDAAGRQDLRKKLDAIARNYARIQKGSRVMANPSGTAGTLANISAATAFGGALMSGNLLIAAKIATVFGSAYVTQRLMTSQAFIKWLANTTSLPPRNIAISLNAVIKEEDDPETKADLIRLRDSLR